MGGRGRAFFCAPEEYVQAFFKQMLPRASRGRVGHVAFSDVMTRGTARRLAAYEQWILEHDVDPRLLFFDLTQRLAYCKGMKTMIGCILTKSVWYSHGAKRPLTPVEQVQLMGIPVFPSLVERASWSCPCASLLVGTPRQDVARLAGNGLHLACVGAVLIWRFGEVIHVDGSNAQAA